MSCEDALSLVLPDPEATERLGEFLGRHLRPGQALGLVGDLGAGKTCLSRGVARGLAVEDPEAVCSPTYLLVIEHPGPVPLLHVDAYLPGKTRAFLADGGVDYLYESKAVVVAEWADRIADLLPDETLWLTLRPLLEGGRRADFRCGAQRVFPWIGEAGKIFTQG